ncbi:MAG TPA: DUF2934 domain-containing protein [Polyangia bacterium]|nr:DUF2934 domain-containing protein [Polyangia bacterium]
MAKSNRAGGGPQPGQDEIARRAYELYLQRGSVPGHETDDWLQAEAELTARAAAGEPEHPAPQRRAASEPTGGRRESASSRRSLRP